jgi:4'-phosphopantetheinyl transferase
MKDALHCFRQQRSRSYVNSLLDWPACKLREGLDPDEVHVWAWSLDSTGVDLPAHEAVLDAAELLRMHAFYFAPDRARYASAHANLRRILGAYLKLPAESLRFRANRFGKPELAEDDPSHTLTFNLSHSQSVALLAVSRDGPVGVDVEDVKPIEPEVATAHFSPSELADLSALQGDAWLTGFYRCWTRKEAVLKAEGVGLNLALDGFDVSLSPDATPELLRTRVHFSYQWKLYDVSPAAGKIGALAIAPSTTKLERFRLLC